MPPQSLRAVLLVTLLLSSSHVVAQTTQPDFDLGPILAQIDDQPDHEIAPKLKELPITALRPIYRLLQQADTPSRTVRLFRGALPDIHKRALQQRTAENKDADTRWCNKTGPDAYYLIGEKNPKWDALVMKAFTELVTSKNDEDARRVFHSFKDAFDAGCTDPLVRYYYATRGMDTHAMAPRGALPILNDAVVKLIKSRYSPSRILHARVRLLQLAAQLAPDELRALSVDTQDSADKCIDLLKQLTPEDVSLNSVKPDVEYLFGRFFVTSYQHEDFIKNISPVLIKLFPNDGFPYAITAEAYIGWAWDARGRGWASSVTDDGWKLFSQRIGEAQKFATKGSDIDPVDTRCPALMITVCVATSADRAVMESWFDHAMFAWPNNYDACSRKVMFLEPKWGGSQQTLVQFGRECVRTGTAENRIPGILIDIHAELATDASDAAVYYAQPDVWNDIQLAYEKLLTPGPDGKMPRQYKFDRARYLRFAGTCRQWSAVAVLINEFNDDFDLQTFGGKALYAYYKRKAKEASPATAP